MDSSDRPEARREGAIGRSVELDEHRPIVRDPNWLPGWWWPAPRKAWGAWAVIGFFALCALVAVLGTVLGHR